MDIRQIFHELFFIILLLCIQYGLSIIQDRDYDEEQSSCPWIRNKLRNGRVRYRYKGRVAKFLCDSGFELAGKRSSTCVRGQWSNPVPVCVARGCSRVPPVSNGRITEMYRGALLVYDCNPGYMIDGEPTIHCDGRRWNTAPPLCVIATDNPETYCDFENPDLCGWSHDPNHDFDWQRNQFKTPSGHVGTGPAFDHTFGDNKAGFYLYIEASSPRKLNDTARLFSPVYPPVLSGGCFIFWYHMYGATTGGLRVYLKPESHVFDELKPKWEKYGDQGDQWFKGHVIVPVLHENFQVVIEGVRGESYVGDSAIDDVRLSSNLCHNDDNYTDITETVDQSSCRGRCLDSGSESSCGCNDNCVNEPNFCCRDYYTICTTGNLTTIRNTDEPLPEDFTTTSSLTTSSAINTTPEELATTTTPEESTTFTTNLITKEIESTNNTFSLTSSTQTSSSVSQTQVLLTTVLPAIPVNHSDLDISSTKSSSSTLQTTLNNTVPPSSLKTEIPSISSTVTKTTEYVSTVTTLSTSSSTTTTITTSLKTTPTSSTAQKTTLSSTTPQKTTVSSTTPQTTTTVQTTVPITNIILETSTTQTTPSEISSTLSSTLKPTTETTSSTVFINDSTTIRIMSSYASPIYTTSSSAATTLSTHPTDPSTTILSSTRKSYNLRPRLKTTLTTPYTTLPTVSTTNKAALTSITPFNEDTSTSSLATRSDTSVKQQSISSSLEPTSRYILPYSSTKIRFATETTIKNVPQTLKFSDQKMKPTESSFTKTSNLFESGATKSETQTSNSSVPIVVTITVILFLSFLAGLAYYIKKQRNKRQSKLSDDSEMRFLEENEYVEYSDSSVLDKIFK